MSLAADAAVLIYCDFAGDAREHDDWHSHEHLRERLSIPGFVRGTRWARDGASPRYMILYEVADAAIIDSPGYLARLNDPSAWTRSIMPGVTGMARAACNVAAAAGYGLGGIALSVRFGSAPGLSHQLPGLRLPAGVASVFLLEPAAPAPMTTEQSLRGRDAEPGWTLVVTGHDGEALRAFAATLCGNAGSAAGTDSALFSLQHTVTSGEALRTQP
jgi:hypothetical protein